MKINHLRITNVLGIDELEFDAGQFTEVSGHAADQAPSQPAQSP